MIRFSKGGHGMALLLASTMLASVGGLPGMPVQAQAQSAQQRHSFSIPAKPVRQALNDIGRITGLSIVFAETPTASTSGRPVSGSLTAAEALSTLLSGTGLSYRFSNAGTVTIVSAGQASAGGVAAPAGATVLDTITISGGGNPVNTPFVTPGATDYISEASIERFRGSSPADIFRGTPGVMSGESRNGAGAVDVNIRGMQGMGRVAVTVDGAENAVTVYQGYQGISNRTFVDPDFLGGIDITKGSDVASNGIAGQVAMRTVNASDIVKEGKRFGLKLKGGLSTNSTEREDNALAGYTWAYNPSVFPTASPTGMDRPAFFKPTGGSASALAAYKDETLELVAGYSYRKRGNYFAGKRGPGAYPVDLGQTTACNWLGCTDYPNYYVNGGLTNYRAGEEVLNTELETKSYLAKGKIYFGDGMSVQLGYNGFRSEAGDLMASRLISSTGQPRQVAQTTRTVVDSGTAQYRWNPDGNDLINVTANGYWTRLQMRNPSRTKVFPARDAFRPGTDTDMWGGDIQNVSKLDTGYGPLALTYGVTYRKEDTRASEGSQYYETWLDFRDGVRSEAAGYSKASWTPVDWLTLNAGLRYQHFWSQDRKNPGENWNRGYDYGTRHSDGGFSPSAGVTLEPWDGTQFYVNYSNMMRSPSLMETVTAFSMQVTPALKPERSSNWEVGTNLIRDNLLFDGDRGMMKLGYFNWDAKDYIGREWGITPQGWSSMMIFNMHRAKFEGIELSARYEQRGFTAELAANYYTNVEFCRTEQTCENKSLYADYATNQVPPEYTVSLTLTQKLMEDALTLGGRVTHVGPRAIGHGDVTAQGASQFIALIDWKPYTLVDVFAEYKINESLTASARVENLFDQYYVDPLGLVQQPGPGRTFYASLTGTF